MFIIYVYRITFNTKKYGDTSNGTDSTTGNKDIVSCLLDL